MSCATESMLSPKAGWLGSSNLHQPISTSQDNIANSLRQISTTLAEPTFVAPDWCRGSLEKHRPSGCPRWSSVRSSWLSSFSSSWGLSPRGLRYCLHLGPLGIIQLFLSGHLTKKSSNILEADGTSNIYLTTQAKNLGVILNPSILLAPPPKHVFLLPPP